jgi:hypothetical protein
MKVQKTEQDWRATLTPEQFRVLRQKVRTHECRRSIGLDIGTCRYIHRGSLFVIVVMSENALLDVLEC